MYFSMHGGNELGQFNFWAPRYYIFSNKRWNGELQLSTKNSLKINVNYYIIGIQENYSLVDKLQALGHLQYQN